MLGTCSRSSGISHNSFPDGTTPDWWLSTAMRRAQCAAKRHGVWACLFQFPICLLLNLAYYCIIVLCSLGLSWHMLGTVKIVVVCLFCLAFLLVWKQCVGLCFNFCGCLFCFVFFLSYNLTMLSWQLCKLSHCCLQHAGIGFSSNCLKV